MLKLPFFKFVIFFLIIFFINIANYLLINTSLTEKKNLNHILKIVEQERMLTQVIDKKAIQYVYMENEAAKKDLITSTREFEDNLNILLNENDYHNYHQVLITEENLYDHFNNIETQWASLKTDLNQIVSNNSDQSLPLIRINTKSERIIHQLDTLANFIEKVSNESLFGLNARYIMFILLILPNVIVLIVIGWLLASLTIFRDISKQKYSENSFKKINKELKDIKTALNISSIVEITDINGVILYVNDKFCDISKYKPEEVIGKTHRILKSGYHTTEFYKKLWETVLQGRVWEGKVKNKAKDGNYYWVQLFIIPFTNEEGEPYQFFTIGYDITARKEAEKEIQTLVSYDHLTHLSNRRKFEHELQQAIDTESSVGILFIDLDRFKYINDSLGHSVGDKLIASVAKRLANIVDKNAIVSRQGGDEFTILVKCYDKDSISNLAREIINSIKQPFIIDHTEILITCSIGISIYPENGKDIGTLMKNADAAMYWTKENGKDGFSIFQDFMQEGSAEIMQLEWELRKAIENKEFTLYYQPKLDLFTKEVIGSEALIRWNHPKKGFISPEEFIPLSEETGLINQIGEMVLREACKQNKVWHQAGYSEFQVAVNLSVHQLKQANIVDVIASILKETELEPRFLELEITESISLLADETHIEKLFALKKLGVSLAIDDFGTGYSSLKYLNKFPVDTLKIDKSFIDEVGKSTHFQSSIMINAIISLAKSLNLEVVAEGIETREQMNYLNKQQCDIGQGYFISKPLPANELEVFLRNYSENLMKVLKTSYGK